MASLINISIIIIISILALVNGSGLGEQLNTSTIMNVAIVCISVILLILGKLKVPSDFQLKTYCTIALLFTTFVAIPYIFADSWQGASYLIGTLLIFSISQLNISKTDISLSGIIVACIGLYVIYVYTQLEILKGWNDNSIAMYALFCYLYYAISLYGVSSKKKYTIAAIITILYLYFLFLTDSRGSMLMIIISSFLVYRNNWFKKIISKKASTFIILNIPLIIAIGTIIIAQTDYYQSLNRYSVDEFGKIAFSERDTIWLNTLKELIDTNFVGTLKFTVNYHNSAIACLGVFGILGYIAWIQGFSILINYIKLYRRDIIVFGCLASFIIIFVQQSVELGFITETPNMIPYMILGISLSRIRQIKQCQK